MASEIVKRSFKPGPWHKPVDWRLEAGWLYREDEAVLHLPDVTKGSWFAGRKGRLGSPHHQLILQSEQGEVSIRAHGANGSPDVRQMRRLAIKALEQIGADAPDAVFRIGHHPFEMASLFLLGITYIAVSIAGLLSGTPGGVIFGLAMAPPGVYAAWKWGPWSARLNASAAEVVAEILKT